MNKAALFWTPKKLRILSWTVLAALLFHIAWIFLTDTRGTSMLKRGDFPSFYSAAMIVRQGLSPKLYDVQLLAYVQNLYWTSLHGNYISFPYPSFVALLLLPFAYFPPLVSKWIFNALMMVLLVLAAKKVFRFSPQLQINPFYTGVFLFSFFPVSFGVLGSQFTALNLFLFAGILYSCFKKTDAGDFWAGIFLGLWFFKPQYAVPLWIFFILGGFTRIALSALAVAAVYYFLGVFVQGWLWPWIWFGAASRAAVLDFPYNDFNMISLAGFFHVLGKAAGPGYARALQLAGVLISASLLFLGSFLFWRLRKVQPETRKREELQSLLEWTAPVLLLASPHALLYDFGICLAALARHLRLEGDKAVNGFLILTLLGSAAAAFKNYLPFQPVFFYGIAAFLFLGRFVLKHKKELR